MISSKKGDPKKSKAYKSIVTLVCRLPSEMTKTWLPTSKLCSLLVEGGVAAQLTTEHVRSAMRYHSKSLFDSRPFQKETWYRHATNFADPTTPDMQPLAIHGAFQLPSDYFRGAEYACHVEAIAEFCNTPPPQTTNKTSTPRSSKQKPKVETRSCRGWSGPTYQKLIALSLKDFIDYGVETSGNVPTELTEFPLARFFSDRKNYGAFIIESEKGGVPFASTESTYIIRTTSCCQQGTYEGGGLCPDCRAFSRSLSSLQCQVKKDVEIHGKNHLTATSIQLMGPKNAAAAVDAIRKQKDGQIKTLTKTVQRLQEKDKFDRERESNNCNNNNTSYETHQTLAAPALAALPHFPAVGPSASSSTERDGYIPVQHPLATPPE
jgi:hypothetical protein